MRPLRVPDTEIAARVGDLQARMADTGLTALVCFGAHPDYAPADLRYLARWSCIDEETSYVFLPGTGRTTLITDASWDLGRAREDASAGEIVFDPDPAVSLARLVRAHANDGDRIGVSGLAVMPAPIFLRLRDALPGFHLEDASVLTTTQRMVKSDLELALMREASRVSDLGVAAGIAAVAEGVPEHAVVAAAEHAIRSSGAEISFRTVMGSGPRTASMTFLPTDRRLEAGDLVVLDCGARVDGYHGDMCRAVTVGPPRNEARRLLETCSAAVRAGIDAARPGGQVRDIRDAAKMVVTAEGLDDAWWGDYMPHGAGAGQHEPPIGLDDGEVELRPGMVLCVEPGVALPGVGGVVLEQMIAITDGAADVLNELPLDLWADRPSRELS